MKLSETSLLWAFVLGLVACEAERAETAVVPRDARAVTQIVARVGGRPIGAADVRARMRRDAVDAEAALEAIVEEELLLHEAGRLGITESPDTQRAVDRMAVRAMLADFERERTPESIPPEEVRADFEEDREKLQVPERRRSWHILVKDSGEAGRRLAERILAEVQSADDPKRVYARYAGGAAPEQDIEVTAEELPLITTKAGIEKPYKDALFAAESRGPLKLPVSTSYGWHVIVLTEIVPGERRTLQDVEEEIRTRLSHKKRFEKLVATVQSLEAEGLVRYEKPNVDRLLSMPGLPEPPD